MKRRVLFIQKMSCVQNFASLLSGEESKVLLLKNIREFWGSNKEFWFSHAEIPSWDIVPSEYYDTVDIQLRLLLHYDQICRHPGSFTSHLKESEKLLGFRFATQLALRILHSEQYEGLRMWEKVFVLLCLRHNPSLGLKQLALTKALALAEEGTDPLILRFLNATIWDVHCWKEKTFGYSEDCVDCAEIFHDILETPTLPNAGFGRIDFEGELCDGHFKRVLQMPQVSGFQRIAVSISGGVDSMVAAMTANRVCKALGKELILLHINYGNRESCEKECDLLRWYARRLGVPLYIREITEMKRCRTSDLRCLYEEITRRIRFSFYAWFSCPVILGHNLDDSFENVFRNLAKQIHFENLFGMSEIGQEQGVLTLRPMLRLAKKDIVAYADMIGIPHLVDSTPAWSQRGQMRDKLIPAISGFDPHILTGLQQFVEHTRFLETQWSLQFDTWIQNSCVKEGIGRIVLPRDAFFSGNSQTLHFWIRFWQSALFANRCHRPSNKSLHNFMEFLKRDTGTRCNLNGVWHARISKERIEIRAIQPTNFSGLETAN